MSLTIAIVAPGEMGSGIARRLAEHHARVLTSLAGRSAATAARARDASMTDASDDELAAADLLLSIVPPAGAPALAERLRPALARAKTTTTYVDCNAVNPETARRIGAILAPTGCRYVDAGIIGGPPKADGSGPSIYVAGPDAARALALRELGLDVRDLQAPLGAASALKMSYAGLTKGFVAIAAAMIGGAVRAGVADALLRELEESQPQMLARATREVPRMYPKAYRWVGEMREIAAFLADDAGGAEIYSGAARLYEQLAQDVRGERAAIERLDRFFAQDVRVQRAQRFPSVPPPR
jgi:3-hydroxyisobutyrate dehydrogenase-like beta-hydroxyacid dehydrogenase